jgi:hypothetical protein
MMICARCGLAKPELFTTLGPRRPLCATCDVRAQMAVDWALAGDAVAEPAQARIEMLESVLCAIEFDRGFGPTFRLRRARENVAQFVERYSTPFVSARWFDEVADFSEIEQRVMAHGREAHERIAMIWGSPPARSFAPAGNGKTVTVAGVTITADAVRVEPAGRPAGKKSRNPFPQPERFNRRGNRGS